MPPKGSTATGSRKTSSSIANSFKGSAKKAGSSSNPFTTAAAGKSGKASSSTTSSLSRSNSLQKLASAPTAANAVRASSSRSASPEKKFAILESAAPGLTEADIKRAQDLPELDVHERKWEGIWKSTTRDKLGRVGAIHADEQNRIHLILRCFDLDPAYGPSLGMTRLQRWQRAKDLGEDPPLEVFEILNTKAGTLQDEYRESCLTGTGI